MGRTLHDGHVDTQIQQENMTAKDLTGCTDRIILKRRNIDWINVPQDGPYMSMMD